MLPLICRPEPGGQLRWVNGLFWLLVIVAGGTAIGIPLGIHGLLGNAWRWLGLQGWEFMQMGRAFQYTLYAAFASRIRELATLQAVGFGRLAVFFSLVQESLVACLAGTLLASVLAMFLLDGLTIPFSIGAFTITVSPTVAVVGLVTGVLLGIIGSIPPAIRCLQSSLPKALRS